MIGDTITATLPRLRAEADALMVEQWECVRSGDYGKPDRFTGAVAREIEWVRDFGPAKLVRANGLREVSAGADVATVKSLILCIPVADGAKVRPGDLWRSESGRQLVTRAEVTGSNPVQRRFNVEEVSDAR